MKVKEKKKVIAGLVILLILLVAAGMFYMRVRPKTQSGDKSITITVVDNERNESLYETKTDAKYLREALENTKGLKIEGTEEEYGLNVKSVNGLSADYEKDGAYWAFYVNGEYCNYGVDQQTIYNGDVFRIVYENAKEDAG